MRTSTSSPTAAPRPVPTITTRSSRTDPPTSPNPTSAARSALRPKLILIAADAAALALSIVLSVAIFERWDPNAGQSPDQLGWAAVVALPNWIGLFANQRL